MMATRDDIFKTEAEPSRGCSVRPSARRPARTGSFDLGDAARPGRSRGRLFRLLPVLALLLGASGLFHAAPAQAQTTLVSNLEQPHTSPQQSTNNQILSQGFTTGSEPGGYTLSSIEAVLGVDENADQSRQRTLREDIANRRGTIRAELWSTSATGASGPGSIATQVDGPYSKIADLAVPSNVSTGPVAFAAPANTTLTPNTPYHFVIYTVGTLQLALSATGSDDEDAGGQTGWSVEDRYWWEAKDTPAFDPGDSSYFRSQDRRQSLRIRVRGSVLPLPSTRGFILSANPNPAAGGSQVTVTLRAIGGRRFRRSRTSLSRKALAWHGGERRPATPRGASAAGVISPSPGPSWGRGKRRPPLESTPQIEATR